MTPTAIACDIRIIRLDRPLLSDMLPCMETVTVVESTRKDSGWYEIDLEDGRKVSTKDRGFADALYQSKGSPIEVEITTKKNGSFTNHYVNAVDGVKESRAPRASGGTASGGSSGVDSNKDKRLASQWAVGRAVELASSGTITMDDIEATAKDLLALAREIEKGL